jgi:transcriptional regulator with PAS, ATPase and Fis domain
MSSALQVKIMRLIEEGTFLRVGGTKTIKVDVRVIGATNKNLRDLVNRNLFREDLYFRLAVFEILIPSLRDRTDDIPLLVDYFINKYQTKMNKKGIQMSKEALDMLIMHNWPGNVRELENEIERACALIDPYGTIMASSLSEKIVKIKKKIPSEGEYLKDLLNEYEGEVILATLNDNKWGKKKVANRLGITQQWLNKRIHMLALDRRKKR